MSSSALTATCQRAAFFRCSLPADGENFGGIAPTGSRKGENRPKGYRDDVCPSI